MNRVLFFVLLGIAGVLGSEINTIPMSQVIHDWGHAAHTWLSRLDCTRQIFLSLPTCQVVQTRRSMHFRLYAAEPASGRKYGAVFPEGGRSNHTLHDSVMVLDPFPTSRFGHPVLVFYVDVMNATEQCNVNAGMISVDNACLKPLSRTACSRYMYRLEPKARFSCTEIDFLPLVYDYQEEPIQINDRLRCMPDIKGFYPTCPRLRPKAETRYNPCGPLTRNKDYECEEDFAQNLLNPCSPFQTCDYAVILSGGWNRQLSDVETLSNVLDMQHLLRNQGFLDENVQTFYANGQGSAKESGLKPDYYPSTQKNNIRRYIKTICDIDNCADTFLLYMNGPTRQDGGILLWDTHDGVVDDMEVYTPREMLRDISHCKAAKVIVMADQGYGSALVDAAVQRYNSLRNVLIFTSNDDFTFNMHKDRMTTALLKSLFTDLCLLDFKNTFYNAFKAPMFIPDTDLLNTTLIGGPCNTASRNLGDPKGLEYSGCSIITTTV